MGNCCSSGNMDNMVNDKKSAKKIQSNESAETPEIIKEPSLHKAKVIP